MSIYLDSSAPLSSAKAPLLVSSKNLLQDAFYHCSIEGDHLRLYKLRDQENEPSRSLKYTVWLRLSATIGWLTRTVNQKLQLIGFTIHINKKQKRFYCDAELSLQKLKEQLASRVSFYDLHELFELREELGRGSSCRVVRGYDRLLQRECAIKMIDKATLKPINYASLEQEIQIMFRLKGKSHFVQVYEVYQSRYSYFIVMQLLKGASLQHHLDSQPNHRRLPMKKVQIIMRRILEAVTQLHQMKLCHRDIKPDNILLAQPNDFNTITVIDFGLSTFTTSERLILSRCGTPGYVAPEILNPSGKRNFPIEICDSFSIGCVFYKLLVGKSAFKAATFDDLLNKNKAGDVDFNVPQDEYVTKDSISLLKSMMQKDPSSRLPPKVALQSSFFYNESYFSINDEDWDQTQLVPQLPVLNVMNGRPLLRDLNSLKSPRYLQGLSTLKIEIPRTNRGFLSPQVSPMRQN